ncbi:centrosomal protein CEP57L1 isoform X2 [Gallus gallus]|nr:centrosomal protein CEP57L1 isoform X2 [Gallus gallus]XP_040524564.1 centrosomal protein CEP57L1 isoform X2 [Gallus gallus]XP_046771132.1 centrosomal protein CEP57L1 isoform X2 [Gallus gallus]
MDSESKDSLIGSFLQPPAKMIPAPFVCGEPKKLAAAGDNGPSICYNQTVVAALRTLQEKIHRLELERPHAEENLYSLSVAAAQYKKALEHESFKNDTAHHKLMQQRKDVSVKLKAAQSRCSLLEKQLDYMRKMVESAELENKMILQQQLYSGLCFLTHLQKEKNQNQMELHAKLEKLDVLEEECLKLTATQRIAEDKIKHLEEKLCKEEHHYKLIQGKAAQLQTEFEINRILMSSDSSKSELKKRSRKKKIPKKKNPITKEMHLPQFHVKAGVLPFVVGKTTYSFFFKSVSSSHSLSANLQSMLHIMKHRNPHISSQRQIQSTSGISGQTTLSKSVTSSSTVTRRPSDLVLGIQDELSQMRLEHQELLKQIQETQESKIHEDLEQRLNCLVKQMDSKRGQISKLKKHQNSVQKLKRKTQKLKKEAARVKPKYGNQKEVKEIAVTVRESMSKSHAGQKSRSSLQLLKNVQKLQSILKKDDIVWEQ